MHANYFVRLRNLREAHRVITAAAVKNEHGKAYKRTYSLKLTVAKIR